MSKPIDRARARRSAQLRSCHSERSALYASRGLQRGEESQLPMLGAARAFACPREQESLFENNAGLTSTPAAPKSLKLLQRFPGSVR